MESKVRRGIGLVAHDAMKKDLIEWVLWNSELLMGNKFYCTGTTGTLILEALKEMHGNTLTITMKPCSTKTAHTTIQKSTSRK